MQPDNNALTKKRMDIHYQIGGFLIRITGEEAAAVRRIPGFEPFEVEIGQVANFTIRLMNEAAAITASQVERTVYTLATEEIISQLDRLVDGRFRLTLTPTEGGESLLLHHRFGSSECLIAGSTKTHLLRFALWTAFGLFTAGQAIAIHASTIVCEGRAVAFLGESGTGKSTHTRLWQEHISGATLLNDDSPVLRLVGDTPYIYGSPWSGKTPCYRAEGFPLAGIVRLSQAPHNAMRQLGAFEAIGALFPSCPPALMKEEEVSGHICGTLSHVLACVPVYHLECLPDEAAARLSYQTVLQK